MVKNTKGINQFSKNKMWRKVHKDLKKIQVEFLEMKNIINDIENSELIKFDKIQLKRKFNKLDHRSEKIT